MRAVTEPSPIEREKRAAAEAAAELVEDGMVVGLGTGSTAAFLVAALGRRRPRIRCVSTSPRTEGLAAGVGLRVEPFETLDRLDLAIDGADLVDPAFWLVKGGGGAHVREKVVAAAADRFVVIVSSDKLVDRLHPPVPVELLGFGLAATLRCLAPVELRDVSPSPDGNRIADYRGPVDDPRALASWLDRVPGVVGHGLFAPELVGEVIVGRGDEVERMVRSS